MKGTRESAVQDEIRLAVGERTGVVLWRNNVGVAEHWRPGATKPDYVRYGLGNGSSDLIGIVRRDDGVGIFVALEVKNRLVDVMTPEQLQWQALVRQHGGVARVVRSVPEALLAIDEARNG